jgi:hypothetical protein
MDISFTNYSHGDSRDRVADQHFFFLGTGDGCFTWGFTVSCGDGA